MTARLTLAALSAADEATFVAALGGIFENSPWIARAAWPARPFASVDALHAAMVRVIDAAPRETRLALIRAHPELAGKEAAEGTMTEDSVGEQKSAGLHRCTREELVRIADLNRRYRERHGFPFVMAVKGASKAEIMAALEARCGNATAAEFDRCLAEIAKIGRLRLAALLESA